MPARAQPAPPVPAVGVVAAQPQAITETNEYVGRVSAVSRVALVARVTAFLDKRLFVEGSEVKKGDLLYVLEQPPFQADLQSKQAAVAQTQAVLANATITLDRARALLNTPAGQRSTFDDATATQRSDAAQVMNAQAQLMISQINMGYTEIHAPIDGQITATNVTEGNVVGPQTGTLATIVSQDPIYVLFPIALRDALTLRDRYAAKGGFSAVVAQLKLPGGKTYKLSGKLDYAAPSVAASTDTLTLRAVFANPLLPTAKAGSSGARELVDGEFVSVLVQGAAPVQQIAIPRAAVLSDQLGDYVYVVDSQNVARQQRIQLGQSTTALAGVVSGLQAGQQVIVDGLQRVRPGQKVAPGPAASGPGASAATLSGGASAPAGAH